MPTGGLTSVDPPEYAVESLSELDLLAGATEDAVEAVAAMVDWWQCQAGAELFARGDRSDGVYLVVRGRLESHVNGVVLGEIGRGGTVGELAILGGGFRTASVRAVRDSLVVRLPPERFASVAEASPQVAVGLARTVARRAVTGPGPPRRRAVPRSIAVLSIDRGRHGDSFADALHERLARMLSARRVRSDDIADWVEAGQSEEVTARLAESEDRHDAIVVSLTGLRLGPEGDELAALVLRQMDVVIAVTEATARPDPVALALLDEAARPVWLILEHHGASVPSTTGRWLELVGTKSEVRGHVHLRDRHLADLDRLARLVVGRSVGVVLGGGGSRGFAHIGVLRALQEAGVHVDLVGGSSMGAIMAAQLAMGWSPDEMLARNTAAWSRRQFFEPTIPTVSLLRGRRGRQVLRGFFGDRRIEDLWIDYFCTTVDLSQYRLHVASSGSVARWVRASATVPGLWPPMVDDDGHLHVDGGMLDNVPTDVMRSSHSGTVIGVDVCHRQSTMRVPPHVPLPTGLALIRARSGGRWFPSIMDVMNRANLLASLQHHEEAESHADLFLTPPAEDEGFAAFDRVAELAAIGYQSASEALERADLGAFT